MLIDGELEEKISEIERVCGRIVKRDISDLVSAAKGDLFKAGKSLAEHPNPRVAIVTGFYIPSANPPAAETDGLGGAVHLAAGLLRAGIQASLITDIPCEGALRAAARAIPEDINVEAVPVLTSAVLRLREKLEKLDPPLTHLVAIERVGLSPDGNPYDMTGVAQTNCSAPLDLLFKDSNWTKKWTTIGIGDGGNEIGMGKVPLEIIKRKIVNGDKIATITPCDYLMACGVSNWGGIGLLATLALLLPDLKDDLTYYLDLETDRRILEYAVYQGPAVQDFRPEEPGRQIMMVDRLPWRRHAELLTEIVGLIS